MPLLEAQLDSFGVELTRGQRKRYQEWNARHPYGGPLLAPRN